MQSYAIICNHITINLLLLDVVCSCVNRQDSLHCTRAHYAEQCLCFGTTIDDDELCRGARRYDFTHLRVLGKGMPELPCVMPVMCISALDTGHAPA